MSSVFLSVGQCGVQLGHAFWTLLEERLDSDGERHPFRTLDGCQRRVLVDTEPKVLASVRRKAQQQGARHKAAKKTTEGHLAIRDANVLVSRRGRGANWAMGYSKAAEARKSGGRGREGGQALVDDVIESVRREVERCDAFSGFVLMHSMSGGTGSGMGSRLAEALRAEYPLAQQLSVCVAPSLQGESPMQSYNCVLCLQHLHEYCDAVLLLENDVLVKCCQEERMDSQHRPPTASMRTFSSLAVDDLNKYAAEMLAGLLLPTDALTYNGWAVGQEPWELVRSVCGMPSLKLFAADHTRQAHARSWTAMAERLVRQQQQLWHHRTRPTALQDSSLAAALARCSAGPSRCVAVTSVARGVHRGLSDRDVCGLEKSLQHGYKCVAWNPRPVSLWTAKSAGGPRASTTLTVASNTSAVCHPLANIVDRAQRMFASRAYLHWYERYDCGPELFREAFETAHTVLGNYAEAVT